MNPVLPYLACVLGAAGLYLLLRPVSRPLKTVGIIVGLGAFGWLILEAGRFLPAPAGGDGHIRPPVIFMIFSLIAVASAVRMITHTRPVYSALYFVMVVLSSAGLFLLLQAEFIAFALVIVYAGAILITYMFVLMLAQQAPTESARGTGASPQNAEPDYDRVPREPGMAAAVGFVMLAIFTNMIFGGVGRLEPAQTASQATAEAWEELNAMPKYVRGLVQQENPDLQLAPDWRVHVRDGIAYVDVVRKGEAQPFELALADDDLPGNVQMVGLSLVADFPVSLELAGVILLLAMFGAVVLARKQIEIGEDEVREAAGMRRLALHSDDHPEHCPGPGGAR